MANAYFHYIFQDNGDSFCDAHCLSKSHETGYTRLHANGSKEWSLILLNISNNELQKQIIQW